MAVTSGFYNAMLDPVTKIPDRLYDAVQISELFDGLIRDGIFMSIGGHFAVTANAGMTVQVASGRAWFNHSWINNDATLPVIVPTSEVLLNRIDALVIDVDSNQGVRANTIKIVKGTPASVPVNPTMAADTRHHQYPLAYIYVGHDVTGIAQANITSAIGTSACPYVTGILETVDLDAFLAQMQAEWADWTEAQRGEVLAWKDQEQGEFTAWFDAMKDQLSTDAAGNLQTQILDHLQDFGNPHRTDARAIGASKVTLSDTAPGNALDLTRGYDVGDRLIMPEMSFTAKNKMYQSWNGDIANQGQPSVQGPASMVWSEGATAQGILYSQVVISGGSPTKDTYCTRSFHISASSGSQIPIVGHKYFMSLTVATIAAAFNGSLAVPGQPEVSFKMYWGPQPSPRLLLETPAWDTMPGVKTFYMKYTVPQDASAAWLASQYVSVIVTQHHGDDNGVLTGTFQMQSPIILDLTDIFGAGNEPSEFFLYELLLAPQYSTIEENRERYFSGSKVFTSQVREFICGKSSENNAVWRETLTSMPAPTGAILTAATGFTLLSSKVYSLGRFVYFEASVLLVTARAAAFNALMLSGLPPASEHVGFTPVILTNAGVPVTGSFRCVLARSDAPGFAGLWFNAVTATTANQILTISGFYLAAV